MFCSFSAKITMFPTSFCTKNEVTLHGPWWPWSLPRKIPGMTCKRIGSLDASDGWRFASGVWWFFEVFFFCWGQNTGVKTHGPHTMYDIYIYIFIYRHENHKKSTIHADKYGSPMDVSMDGMGKCLLLSTKAHQMCLWIWCSTSIWPVL